MLKWDAFYESCPTLSSSSHGVPYCYKLGFYNKVAAVWSLHLV